MAAMADAQSGNVSGGGAAANFGNTGHALVKPYTGTECTVQAGYNVGDYVTGGALAVSGSYTISTSGSVSQEWFKP